MRGVWVETRGVSVSTRGMSLEHDAMDWDDVHGLLFEWESGL